MAVVVVLIARGWTRNLVVSIGRKMIPINLKQKI